MRCPSHRSAFTLVEVMVVVAIIAALIGILLPALSIIRRNADLVSSQSNMRTIGAFMTAYALDNRDHVVPSRFDYRNAGGRALVWQVDIHSFVCDWLRERFEGKPLKHAGKVLWLDPNGGGPNAKTVSHKRYWYE